MNIIRLLLLSLSLAAPLASRAQTSPNAARISSERVRSYQTEYDSLQLRATTIRTRTEASIVRFKSAFVALKGTNRRTRSYALLSSTKSSLSNAPALAVLVKKQVEKHKTQGVEIEKVRYYGAGKRLLLYEYYEQHQLIHQVLNEYPTRGSQEYAVPFRTTTWVRGDYLSLTIWPRVGAGDRKKAAMRYYFTAPKPLN